MKLIVTASYLLQIEQEHLNFNPNKSRKEENITDNLEPKKPKKEKK